jgi:hypothetical protein
MNVLSSGIVVQNTLHIYEGPPHVKAKESWVLISSICWFHFWFYKLAFSKQNSRKFICINFIMIVYITFKFMVAKNDMRVSMTWRSNYIKNKNRRIYHLIKMMHFLAQLSLALMYYKMCIKISPYCTKIPEVKQNQWRWHFYSILHLNTCFLLCHLIVRYTSQPLFFLSYDVMFQHIPIYLHNVFIILKINPSKLRKKDFSTSYMYSYWYYCFFICLWLMTVSYIITFHIMSRHSQSIIHV